MITLYELHWSHYCEKIRLALDYMGLPWQMQEINGFAKDELKTHTKPAHLPNYTVPAIWDDTTQTFVMDSTDIVQYLVRTYPDAPALLPGDTANQAAIHSAMLEFDSELGLAARRFGYTQVILECPDLLADLFTSHLANGLFARPIVRHLTGFFLSMLLTQRFDFHLSEKLGLYEALEHYLLQLTQRLNGRAYVVGNAFSIADLAFAAQLRPISVVPFFREHPALQPLWERHASTMAAYGQRELELIYQTELALRRAGKQGAPARNPWRRRLCDAIPLLPTAVMASQSPYVTQSITAGKAANDQRPIWAWRMASMPFHVLWTLRRNKRRQALASAEWR